MKKAEAKEIFLKNPYWVKVYEQAGEKLQRWYDEAFYFSLSGRGRKNLAKIEAEFTQEDWQKLIDRAKTATAKIEYTKSMNGLVRQGTEILNPKYWEEPSD